MRAGEPQAPDADSLDAQIQRARRNYLRELDGDSNFGRLCEAFELGECDRQVLLVSLAPELDAKYETLYAYLNNDVTRKAPTLSLIDRLLRSEQQSATEVRCSLLPDAPLLRHGLVRYAPGSERHATLNSAILVHRALPSVVLGMGFRIEGTLISHVPATQIRAHPVAGEDELRRRIAHSAQAWRAGAQRPAPLWLFHGRDAERRADAVRSLADALGSDLLDLDCGALQAPDDAVAVFRDALLWQRLTGAVLHLRGLEHEAEIRPRPELHAAMRLLKDAPLPVCIDVENPAVALDGMRDSDVIRLAVPELARVARAAAWQCALAHRGLRAEDTALAIVADSFALTMAQIGRAARLLADDPDTRTGSALEARQLCAAARGCSDASLAGLAQKLHLPFDWQDLILPPSVARRLQDIVRAIRDRRVVFGDWGYARLAGGFGLRVLFAGPSGTGKTMAAATVARELDIDIYRVDISQTVSKYIGETEKNLDRIFNAAATSNAILFFDEADALFGKRSEVKDAHDRYSNIETSYLLQKIEDYQGIVFLASNLSRNMDTAFSRRLNFVLEFPLPDRGDRERLWRSMLSGTAPLAADIDFAFLASQFTLSGGEIRNVVLDAAFLAARGAERRVSMKDLIVALGRQLTKQGRAPSVTEFKQHHGLLAELGGEESS
ncbi:MAG: ATP-binding protein [Gammaproteobacteria bacterium]|nr:ATP-binding protein [Gammaproteobacteria bacterium]MDH4312001.1 ATP-binding protein [Gammaproteobacteria bacterium]MDH5272440.1 ATP-binding protein [Gammaproteobacteria bacterium]